MNDLTILHLSDLHIDDSEGNYSRLLGSLIEDIKVEMKYVRDNSVIIAVTGDLLHRGPLYSVSDTAFSNAVKFFSKLYQVVKDKVIKIYIVPGNHDKFRSDEDKFLIPSYRSITAIAHSVSDNLSKFGEMFYKNFWKHHLASYSETSGSGYLKLVKEIYRIFGYSDEELECADFVRETFGIDLINVSGKNYCFIMLNTAWSCFDESDNRNLILGKFQIELLKKQFKQKIEALPDGARPEVTIVLGHHPLSALNGTEEDAIFSEMISFDSFDADIYLCGHTHDRTVNNWINNRHSLTTLVTGFGWPLQERTQNIRDHFYSMYVLNIDANSIDVYVRNADDAGKFQPDFRIYTNDWSEKKKIVFPIHAQDVHTYLPLHVGNNRSPKAFYISDSFMKYIAQYSRRLQWLCVEAERIIEDHRSQIYDEMLIDGEDEKLNDELDECLYNYLFSDIANQPEDTPEKIATIFKQSRSTLNSLFLSFLTELCQRMQNTLIGDQLSENDIVRFHFRYLFDRSSLQYQCLCKSLPNSVDKAQYEVSPIKYGELIEASYTSGESLIYSVNKEFTEHELKERWTNFITVIPLFDSNNYKKNDGRKKKEYPYLTFGVTVNNDKYNVLLYCMDYLSIKELLGDLIDRYIRIFLIDIDDFCKWAKKQIEQGEECT